MFKFITTCILLFLSGIDCKAAKTDSEEAFSKETNALGESDTPWRKTLSAPRLKRDVADKPPAPADLDPATAHPVASTLSFYSRLMALGSLVLAALVELSIYAYETYLNSLHN